MSDDKETPEERAAYERKRMADRLPEIEPMVWMVFAAATIASGNTRPNDAGKPADSLVAEWKRRFT